MQQKLGAVRRYADGGQVVKQPHPHSIKGLFNSAKGLVSGLQDKISSAIGPETAVQGQARRAAEYDAMKAKYAAQPSPPTPPTPPAQPAQGVSAGLDGAGGTSLDKRMKEAGAYADGGIVQPVGAFRRGGRVRADKKKINYSEGAKLKGPGTAKSDDIDAEIVETGEPIRVANGERILSAEQEKYMQGVAKLSGHESVDDMLRMGTGKPVGPTIKYVPGGARRGASGGMVIGSGSVTDDKMANQMATPLKPTNLQDAVADASFNSMSGIATQDRLNGNNVEEAQLRINNGAQDFARQGQAVTRRTYSSGGPVMTTETDEEGKNKTFVSRNGGKTELLSPIEIANSERSLNQYREDNRMIASGANPLLNIMHNVPEFANGGKICRGGAVRRFKDGGSTDTEVLLGQIPTGGTRAGPTPAAQQPITTYEDKFMPATRAVVSGAADDVGRNIKEGNYGAAVGNAVRGSAGVGPAIIADSWRPWGGAARQVANAASTAFGGSETPMQPEAKSSQPVVRPAQPEAKPEQASYSNEGNRLPAPVGAIRKATDVGFGVTRIDEPGKSPLFTNLEGGADHASNVALMNRKPMTPQDQKALDNLTAKYDAQVRGALAVERYNNEVAAANAANAANMRLAERQARERELTQARKENEMRISSRNALPSEIKRAQAALESLDAIRRDGYARDAMNDIASDNLAQRQRELAIVQAQAAEQAADRRARGAIDQGKHAIEQAQEGRNATIFSQQQANQKRIQDLYAQYQTAPSHERDAIEQQIRVLSGKDPEKRYKTHILPTIKNADGSTTEGGVYVEDNRTGQGDWATKNQASAALPAGLVVGAPTKQADGTYQAGGKSVTIKGGKVTEIK